MQGQMGVFKLRAEEQNKSELEEPQQFEKASAFPAATSDIEREKEEVPQKNKAVLKLGEEVGEEKGGDKAVPTENKAVPTENKAAKIQRLKSGFRICKPQGTFLWPNMAVSPQGGVQLDDLAVVPTPPSVSSATSTTHLLPPPQTHLGLLPSSPVKPMARRPVSSIAFSNVTMAPPSLVSLPVNFTTSSQTTGASETSLLNLNEFPQTHYDETAFSGTLTYQRRSNQNVIAFPDMPRLVVDDKENEEDERREDIKAHTEKQNDQQKECSSSSGSTPWWLSMREGWWLDLATPDSSLKCSKIG